MLGSLWNSLLFQPLLNLLVFFYQLLGQSLGWAVLALTVSTRLLLLPLTINSLKAAQKQRELAPLLKEISAKYANDKKKISEEQLRLFREHGINPGSGCLVQIAQIVILISLYQAFVRLLGADSQALATLNQALYFPQLALGGELKVNFWLWDLTKPDPYYVLPVLAAVFQFLLAKAMLPVVAKEEKLAEATVDQKDDLAYNMQEQFLYITPMMTVFIGLKLPAGLAWYWLATTLFSLGQQIIFSGWGGLAPWVKALSKYRCWKK